MNPIESLEQHYPEIIQQMGKRFNSHQFILKLAHQHQGLYIRALSKYVDSRVPFQVVHGQLAQALSKFGYLITQEPDDDEDSKDIFGHTNSATVWVKR